MWKTGPHCVALLGLSLLCGPVWAQKHKDPLASASLTSAEIKTGATTQTGFDFFFKSFFVFYGFVQMRILSNFKWLSKYGNCLKPIAWSDPPTSPHRSVFRILYHLAAEDS